MKTARMLGAITLLTTTAFGAQSALAYQAGDIYVRAGFEKTDSSSSTFKVDGKKQSVDDDIVFGYGAGYLFHNNFGVELNGSQTAKQELSGHGTIESTPVNLMLNYFPLGGHVSRIQPYVGIGVNYTNFDTDSNFDADIDDSWGFAAQVGVDLSIAENILVGMYGHYAEVDPDATINDKDVGGIEIDPLVIGAGLTYRF